MWVTNHLSCMTRKVSLYLIWLRFQFPTLYYFIIMKRLNLFWYFAAVGYVDAQIGRVLEELKPQLKVMN